MTESRKNTEDNLPAGSAPNAGGAFPARATTPAMEDETTVGMAADSDPGALQPSAKLRKRLKALLEADKEAARVLQGLLTRQPADTLSYSDLQTGVQQTGTCYRLELTAEQCEVVSQEILAAVRQSPEGKGLGFGSLEAGSPPLLSLAQGAALLMAARAYFKGIRDPETLVEIVSHRQQEYQEHGAVKFD